MKVLVIGGLGRIGTRYRAILNYLGIPNVTHDIRQDCEPWEEIDFTHAIIATPTNQHFVYMHRLAELGKPFLCEKPVSKKLEEIEPFTGYKQGYVVNNYAYMFNKFEKDSCKITYDYFCTGQDGVAWDCIQLLYLDQDATINTKSPIWMVFNREKKYTYADVEWSYVSMIIDFLGEKRHLWDLNVGYEMTVRAMERCAR